MVSVGLPPVSQRDRTLQIALLWSPGSVTDATPSVGRAASIGARALIVLVAAALLASTLGVAAGTAAASSGGVSAADSAANSPVDSPVDSTADATLGSNTVHASAAVSSGAPQEIASSGNAVTASSVQQSAIDLPNSVDVAVQSTPAESIVLLGAYSKSGERSDQDHPVRADVDDVVNRLPGLHFAAVVRHVDSPEGTVRYHARVLESDGHVQTEQIWGTLRLFPLATEPDDFELFAAARDDALSRVLESIGNSEPATVSELADSLDRAPSTVSHHLGRLEEAGLIVRERAGQSVHVSLDPNVRERVTYGGAGVDESSGQHDVELSGD